MYYAMNNSPVLSSDKASWPRRTIHEYDLLQIFHHFQYVKELTGNLPQKLIPQYIRCFE